MSDPGPVHLRPALARRRTQLAMVTATLVLAVAAAVVWVRTTGGTHTRADSPPAVSSPRSTAPPASATRSSSSAATSSTPAPPANPELSVAAANSSIVRLVHGAPKGSTAVQALDVGSGRAYAYAATHRAWTASLIKLDFLEVLLARHQHLDEEITSGEDADLVQMIERSDNGAADRVYNAYDGGQTVVTHWNKKLGLRNTTIGDDDFWGLSKTSAADQVTLLHNLVDPHGPLDAGSRRYALRLMRNVQGDQRWGASAPADKGSTPAIKNGWLGIDNDGGRWAVNSAAVVTVRGRQLLICALSQHNADFASSVRLVTRLSKIAAAAVVPPA